MKRFTDKNKVLRDFRIQVSVPSGDQWEADFGNSICGMMYDCASKRLTEDTHTQGLSLVNVRSSLLPQSRETLVKGAIESGCTHMLFLDSDMKFPKEVLRRLLARNHQVIGVNYVRKIIPSFPVAVNLDGSLCYSDPNSPEVQEVHHTGFGCLLLDLSIFKDIPQPWFNITWDDKLQMYSGEDVYFFMKVREAGYPVYVDHVLSREIAHVGMFAYDHNVIGEVYTETFEDIKNEVHAAEG